MQVVTISDMLKCFKHLILACKTRISVRSLFKKLKGLLNKALPDLEKVKMYKHKSNQEVKLLSTRHRPHVRLNQNILCFNDDLMIILKRMHNINIR